MNPQLAKEFRALLLPWTIAASAGLMTPLLGLLGGLHVIETGEFLNFLSAFVGFTFLGSLLAIAASSFGGEFQHRTLPLLLSQPTSRMLLWKNKLLVSFSAIVAVILLQAAACLLLFKIHYLPADFGSAWEHALLACAFLIPTLGSVGYWTLLSRSTLSGMVFTAFGQFLAVGILAAIADRLGIPAKSQWSILVGAGVAYGCVFFWLSWRRFSRLQASQLLPDGLTGSKSLTVRGWRLDWLRARPDAGLLNLIRKEIQLQKPIVMIAAVFSALWLLTYLLLALRPSYLNLLEIVYALTIGFYIPLIALLAGCVSLGEEKTLGLTAWYLTLPISIRQQWTVKLAVGCATWLLLGLALPFCLSHVGFAIGLRTLNELDFGNWLGFALFGTGIFALSFWAMTLFDNAVRAVVASLAILIAICCSALLAFWTGVGLKDPQRLGAPALLGVLTVILALVQSLLRFRRLRTSWGVITRYSCLLIGVTFLEFFFYMLLQS